MPPPPPSLAPAAAVRGIDSTACTAASSNTTPGTIGVPGKWPANAGWSGAPQDQIASGNIYPF